MGALGCSVNVLAIDSKNRLRFQDAWQLVQQKHALMSWSPPSHAIQGWLTVQKPIQPIHLPWRHIVLVRQLPLRFPSTSFKSRWPRFLKNLRIKKILFDIIMGPACPTHCYGPRLFFLEAAHDWANVFVLCISHCLVLKQVLKEKMRETIGTYSTKTYSKLHSIDIRTGNTKDGWKKHGIKRQPFFWFGTPSNKIEMQMTKIPKESADQKDIIWYYHGSCMPKTLLWSKAILFGGSTWLSKCVRALHFPLLGFETGLERENAWNCWDIRRPTPSYIRSISELVIPRTVGKRTV